MFISPRGHSSARPSHPCWRSAGALWAWPWRATRTHLGTGVTTTRAEARPTEVGWSYGGAATSATFRREVHRSAASRLARSQRGVATNTRHPSVIVRGPSGLRRQAGESATIARTIEGLVPEVLREEQARARPPEVPSIALRAGMRARWEKRDPSHRGCLLKSPGARPDSRPCETRWGEDICPSPHRSDPARLLRLKRRGS